MGGKAIEDGEGSVRFEEILGDRRYVIVILANERRVNQLEQSVIARHSKGTGSYEACNLEFKGKQICRI